MFYQLKASGARAERGEGLFAFTPRHVSMHVGNCAVLLVEFFREPVDLSTCVAEDDGPRDGDRVVEVTKGIKFGVLLNSDVVLLNAVEGEHLFVDKNAHRVSHDFVRHREDVLGDRS